MILARPRPLRDLHRRARARLAGTSSASRRGRKITVSLSGLPADYDVVVFKDIYQAFVKQLLPTDATALNRLNAEFAPSTFSPSTFSPSTFSPSTFSPDAYAPSTFSPSTFSPSMFSPVDVLSRRRSQSVDVLAIDVQSVDIHAHRRSARRRSRPRRSAPSTFSPPATVPASTTFDARFSRRSRARRRAKHHRCLRHTWHCVKRIWSVLNT